MREQVAFVDFETRSRVDIKRGLERYFADQECEALMLAYCLPGESEVKQWHRNFDLSGSVELPEDLATYVREGGLISGFNVMFEFHCWNRVCAPKYGWPELKLEQLRDTMALAAAHNLPQSLGRCAEVLGLPSDQQKDKRGKYLIQRLCKPHKPTKKRTGIWVEDEALFAEFLEYNKRDVVAEMGVAKKLRPLSPHEQQVWLFTQRLNLRGLPLAVDEIEVIVEILEIEKDRLNSELAEITDGAVLKASNRNGLLAWCNDQMQEFSSVIDFEDGLEEDGLDPAAGGHEEPLMENMRGKTVEEVLKRDDLPPKVRRALEIRAAVVQTSTAKFAKMLEIVADDGTAKNLFVYHGAGTGRWASRGGLNAQNFPRPIFKSIDVATAFELIRYGLREGAAAAHDALFSLFGDQVMDALVSCLRGVIKAPEGHEFLDADYSSVENRVSAWIAGQRDKLDLFAKGLDEYKVFATMLFGVTYEEVTGDQRQIAKSAVLGCMFGQGWKGLIEYAKPLGVHLTDERSQEIVKLYRSEYDQVKALWYECGDAALAAVRNPGEWISAGEKLELVFHKGFLWMRLPSRRLISWFAPRIEERLAPWKRKVERVVTDDSGQARVIQVEEDVWIDSVTVEGIDQKTRQWKRFALIGSSIFQSAVQGTARDILAIGAIRAEEAGYPPVLLAHDEDMALVRAGAGDEDEFGRLLCQAEEWFNDLPLNYEAWRNERFRK